MKFNKKKSINHLIIAQKSKRRRRRKNNCMNSLTNFEFDRKYLRDYLFKQSYNDIYVFVKRSNV